MANNKICLVFLTLASIFLLVQSQDLKPFLMDQRIVQREIRCVLQRGHCDIIGRQIKDLLPEALDNNCGRCDQRQKRHAQNLMDFMRTNYPNEWNMIVRLYSRKYRSP